MKTFEQKRELNRFVDPSIPLTWKYRWSRLKLFLPLVVFTSVLCSEAILFRAWLADKSLVSAITSCVALTLIFCTFIFFGFEFLLRAGHRSKRTLQLRDDCVFIGSHRILWEQIRAWQFEPMADYPEYSKLTVETVPQKKSKSRRRGFWQIALEKSTQVPELISELELYKQRRLANYEIKIWNEAQPPQRPGKLPSTGMWLSIIGLLLFIHGLPMLAAGLDSEHNHSNQDVQLTPAEEAKLGRFMLAHFSSVQELKHFYITVGGALTFLGVVFMAWGWMSMSRDRKRFELEENR